MTTARQHARAEILRRANRSAIMRTYTMKHIQLAVHRCRQFGLVTRDTLADAGFNPRGGR